jgi:allantoin racemase
VKGYYLKLRRCEMTRICVINIQKEEISRSFIAATEKALEKVRRPDTQITIKSPRRGPEIYSQMANTYGLFLTSGEIIERILEAENEGYDAVVVNGTLDRYLGIQQAKSIVNIPVISPSEVTFHFACLLGHKFGIVAIGESFLKPFMESIIVQHGLQNRAIPNPVKFMSLKHEELMAKIRESPSSIVPGVLDVAKKCVEVGAEVIILIGTNLGVACTLAGLASFNINGFEVPLLDPLTIGLKTAETMADLKGKLGLPPVSRIGVHHLVSSTDLRGVRAEFGLGSK